MKIADSILKSSKLLLLFLFEKDKVVQFILLCIIKTIFNIETLVWFLLIYTKKIYTKENVYIHIDIIKFMFYWGE